jgi:hypothetical protein
MTTSADRKFLTVSTQAHRHLGKVVKAMIRNGYRANGTMVASQIILSIPIPEPTNPTPAKRRASKPVITSTAGTGAAV